MATRSEHFLDGSLARMLAGLIALAALFALSQVWLNATRMNPAGQPLAGAASALSDPSSNAAFEKCKAERTADVDHLLSQGLITAAQHADYRERAIATCAGQFPPVKAE